MEITDPFPPLCPITGLPAKRRIQQVSGALLIALWRASFGVSAERQLRDVKRFGFGARPKGTQFAGCGRLCLPIMRSERSADGDRRAK
jgi:hypothetical protein